MITRGERSLTSLTVQAARPAPRRTLSLVPRHRWQSSTRTPRAKRHTVRRSPAPCLRLLGASSIVRSETVGMVSVCAAHPEFSGRMLRIDGYWRDSSTGMMVLRRVGIVYYLEDDTMSVKVLADKKRGIAESQILRKHLVPKPDGNEMYTWRELGPGVDLNLFGRFIHIVSADKVSRLWMDRQGKAEGIFFKDNEEMPAELLPSAQTVQPERKRSTRNDPGRRFMLARMGIVDKQLEDVAKFMQFDGQVLNFKCVWDDPSLGHEGLRDFELNYYLVDDTVVVQEVGVRAPLVKRSRIPKKFDWKTQDLRPLAPGSVETIEFLTLDDLEVGATVDVLGRQMRVYDCDANSRSLARELLQREFAPPTGAPQDKHLAGQAPSALRRTAAAQNKEASQAPPWSQSHDTLTYTLKLVSSNREDASREFTMTLAVDTEEVGLMEKPNVNLGISGGKLLAPVPVPFVPVMSETYDGPTRWDGVGAAPEMVHVGRRMLGPADCVVGSLINIMGTKYKIVSADTATHNFMETYPAHFPGSDSSNLMNRLRSQANATLSREVMETARRGLDPNNTGMVEGSFFRQFLSFLNFGLSDQEQETLARQFAFTGPGAAAGTVQLQAFIDALTS